MRCKSYSLNYIYYYISHIFFLPDIVSFIVDLHMHGMAWHLMMVFCVCVYIYGVEKNVFLCMSQNFMSFPLCEDGGRERMRERERETAEVCFFFLRVIYLSCAGRR